MIKRVLKAFVGLAAGLAVHMAASASTVTYYHNDLLGSPAVATDASGNVVWRESYRPYGERLVNSAAATGNQIWFTGRRQDPETGLVYMGARYYDPITGRFVSTDPKMFDPSSVMSFNRYAYANDNPYKYKDPNGESPLILLAFGYGAGVLADAASQYAAWGDVDWRLAATSSAALSGAAAGLIGGGAVGLTVERVGAEAIVERTAARSGESYVEGYRAVSKAEAEDIATNGFRPAPTGRSMSDKWFLETREGAEQWQKNYPDLEEIVRAKVPRDVYERSYRHPNIDNAGPGFCVQCADLPLIRTP